MEIKVKIPDELAAQAKARGIAVEEYVQELLALRASPRSNVGRLRSSEEVRAWLDSLTQFSDKIPQLPEEAFTRESFYQDDE
jgi:post-segregation antitoxin (ccd killing protein)